MTIIKENLDFHKLISEYVEHLYNECPNSFVVAKDGIEGILASQNDLSTWTISLSYNF